jgi:hypothetical protein
MIIKINTMATTFTKPDSSQLTAYQKIYIDKVPDGELTEILENNIQYTLKMMRSLSSEELSYRYAEGKWTIPEIMLHISDSERIFAYRMLCIARGDKTPLPGFEENDYAKTSQANARSFMDILDELVSVRKATITLMKSFTHEMVLRKGTSNNMPVSVQQLAYMLTGHGLHHLAVIREKYLK